MTNLTKGDVEALEAINHAFIRDLSTCTEAEMLSRWDDDKGTVIERVHKRDFPDIVADHNPMFYIAANVFFDNDPTLLYPPLHRDILCRALLENLTAPPQSTSGLIVCIQRESYKTTFTHGVEALFYALRMKHLENKDSRIALIHHKELQASQNLISLKEKLMYHPWIREHWPEFHCDRDPGTKTTFNLPCRTKGTSISENSFHAYGLGAANTGFHFDLMIFSDATTEDHRYSQVIRDDALWRFESTITMKDTLTGRMSYDATFWHPHDLTQKLLKTQHHDAEAYSNVIIGAGGERVGKPLTFPNRHTEEFLERRRSEIVGKQGNDDFWYLQYQNELHAERMLATDPNWLRYATIRQVPDDAFRCIFVDQAWKGSDAAGKGDSAAIACMAFATHGHVTKRYLLDLVVSNDMTMNDGVRTIVKMAKRYDVYDIAPQEYGGFGLTSMLEESFDSHGHPVEFHKLANARKSKDNVRIASLANIAQAGYFYIVTDTCKAKDEFIKQFTDWPSCEHDDALDAVADCCDPNIVEQVMPVLGRNSMHDAVHVPAERRSRHCMY